MNELNDSPQRHKLHFNIVLLLGHVEDGTSWIPLRTCPLLTYVKVDNRMCLIYCYLLYSLAII